GHTRSNASDGESLRGRNRLLYHKYWLSISDFGGFRNLENHLNASAREARILQKNFSGGRSPCPTTNLSATVARRSSQKSYRSLTTKRATSIVRTAEARMSSSAGPRSAFSHRRRAPELTISISGLESGHAGSDLSGDSLEKHL